MSCYILLVTTTVTLNCLIQVGNGGADHGYWGRPENMTMARPAYKITETNPGSDVAGETAAAMAAGYLAFKTVSKWFPHLCSRSNSATRKAMFGVGFV